MAAKSKTVFATFLRIGNQSKSFSTRMPRPTDAAQAGKWALIHFPGYDRILIPSMKIDTIVR